MDIDLLSKMVKELILDRDRVVLPGLGTFVAEIVPAAFSDKGFTINPPYRKLYFRARTEDDSSLAELYSRSNNVGIDVASRILSDFLKELRVVLQEKKLVVFPGLGRLRATRENNFFFVPDEGLDIYPEGYGLMPISLKSHTETKAELAAAVVEIRSMLPQTPEQTSLNVLESSHAENCGASAEIPDSGTETVSGTGASNADESAFPTESAGKRKRETVLYIVLALAAVLVLAFVAFVILGRVSPGIFDGILYDNEQLKVLEYLSE